MQTIRCSTCGQQTVVEALTGTGTIRCHQCGAVIALPPNFPSWAPEAAGAEETRGTVAPTPAKMSTADVPVAEPVPPAPTVPSPVRPSVPPTRPAVASRQRLGSRRKKISIAAVLGAVFGSLTLLAVIVGVVAFLLVYLVKQPAQPPSPQQAADMPQPPFGPPPDSNHRQLPDWLFEFLQKPGANLDEVLAHRAQIAELHMGPWVFYPGKASPASGTHRTKPTNVEGRLSREVLEKAKAATVLIEVATSGNRQGQGSGFFAVEPGLVVTNAHVVGMLKPGAASPQSITVAVHSGEQNEKKYPGKLVKVAPADDLAVIRIASDDLPEPLSVGSSSMVGETETVYVLGFPLGTERGRNVAVTEGKVASFLKDSLGKQVRFIEIRGESTMLPGNSGGPVIDATGHVIGVSVQINVQFIGGVVQHTGINRAVAAERLRDLLEGAIESVVVMPPASRGATLHRVPPEVRTGTTATSPTRWVIPLEIKKRAGVKRLHVREVEWWISEDRKAPSPAQPYRAATQSRGAADYAELFLDQWPGDKFCCFRIAYTVAGHKETKYTDILSFKLGAPWLDQPIHIEKPSTQAARYRIDASADVVVQQNENRRFNYRMDYTTDVHVNDRESAPSRQFSLDNFRLGLALDGKDIPAGAAEPLRNKRFDAGAIEEAQLAVNKLPEQQRAPATLVYPNLQRWLTICLPHCSPGQWQPGHKWTAQVELPIDAVDSVSLPSVQVEYTYVGKRSEKDADVALVIFRGGIPNADVELLGSVLYDLRRGKVREAKSYLRAGSTPIPNQQLALVKGEYQVQMTWQPND
ncbi:MAG: hypothetical protein C4297_08705 [Gemmataceae bacterium]